MKDIFNTIDMLVAPTQKKYQEGVEWLVWEGMRASGRTHLLAVAFIKEALKSPVPIYVWDHHKPQYHETIRNRHIFTEIEKCVNDINDMLKGKEKLKLMVNVPNKSIQIVIDAEITYAYTRDLF